MTLSWHSHPGSYATLVIAGGYVEAGDFGRTTVLPGDVLMHGDLDAHSNRFSRTDTELLNLPLAWIATAGPSAKFRALDPDLIARTAERDRRHAAELLLEQLEASSSLEFVDWPDLLAQALQSDPRMPIGEWAAMNRLSPATVSRGFFAAFGITPQAYRRRQRARMAIDALGATTLPLAALAAELGFCDQAQMTRDVGWLSGRTPRAWRQGQKATRIRAR